MKPAADDTRQIAANRKAFHDYFVEDRIEAGIALVGTEVKSLREGRVNLRDSYAEVREGEVYLIGAHISPYEQGNICQSRPPAAAQAAPARPRDRPPAAEDQRARLHARADPHVLSRQPGQGRDRPGARQEAVRQARRPRHPRRPARRRARPAAPRRRPLAAPRRLPPLTLVKAASISLVRPFAPASIGSNRGPAPSRPPWGGVAAMDGRPYRGKTAGRQPFSTDRRPPWVSLETGGPPRARKGARTRGGRRRMSPAGSGVGHGARRRRMTDDAGTTDRRPGGDGEAGWRFTRRKFLIGSAVVAGAAAAGAKLADDTFLGGLQPAEAAAPAGRRAARPDRPLQQLRRCLRPPGPRRRRPA